MRDKIFYALLLVLAPTAANAGFSFDKITEGAAKAAKAVCDTTESAADTGVMRQARPQMQSARASTPPKRACGTSQRRKPEPWWETTRSSSHTDSTKAKPFSF